MTRLTVTSSPAMGPLEVTVYSNEGEPLEFTLSSGDTQWSQEVAPGANTVVARRPDGTKLTRTTLVGAGDSVVDLSILIPPSPNEFMQDEAARGLVSAAPAAASPRSVSEWALPLGGSLNRALANAAYSVSDAAPSAPPSSDLSFGADPSNATLRSSLRFTFGRRLKLVAWAFRNGAWAPLEALAAQAFPGHGVATSPNFLKVLVREPWPCALGLLDEEGFGPIVMAPPFLRGVEITFIAKAAYLRAADRRRLGNGARAPVALVTPQEAAVSDLLSALAGARVDRAADLWSQASSSVAQGMPTIAQEMVMDKATAPSEALLGAHFLLRFLPKQLDTQWADNLSAQLPEVADGPVIAAWARLSNATQTESVNAVQDDVDRLVRNALRRPVTLFARTRSLLFDALHYVGGQLSDEDTTTLRGYRRFGADAAGLESFWGASPILPGEGSSQMPSALMEVSLRDGLFDAR